MVFKRITIQDSVPIVFGIVLISIIIAIAIKLTMDGGSPSTTPHTPTPAIPPTPVGSSFIPQPIYNQEAQNRLMEKIEQRETLSESDMVAKKRILSTLTENQNYGVLYEDNRIRIDYTRGPDLFQVEILTTEINSAKGEGNAWFRNQGMSQEGICNHPVDFYLSWEVKQQLEGKIVSFSPLAPNCK